MIELNRKLSKRSKKELEDGFERRNADPFILFDILTRRRKRSHSRLRIKKGLNTKRHNWKRFSYTEEDQKSLQNKAKRRTLNSAKFRQRKVSLECDSNLLGPDGKTKAQHAPNKENPRRYTFKWNAEFRPYGTRFNTTLNEFPCCHLTWLHGRD